MGDRLAVRLSWSGTGLAFHGGGTDPKTPAVQIDGDGKRGPSPMLTLLLACAGCTGADVVHVLGKMRVVLRELTIDVEGQRRDDDPRRYTSIRLRYRLSGDGLDRAKADRAVGLSLEKYCSAVHSLAPDMDIDYDVEVA
jgi:putative redox protein